MNDIDTNVHGKIPGSVSRASADSETVTFYGVEPKNTALSAPAFVSFSPIGVGTDGATTYIEEVRESVGVIVNQVGSSSTTVTTTFPVQTYQGTLNFVKSLMRSEHGLPYSYGRD